MEEERWNTFFCTGKVEDYLSYVRERDQETSMNRGDGHEEVRGLERASDGNGAVSSDHWRVR